MKKFFGYAIGAAVLVLPFVAFAAEFRFGEQPSVTADEHIVNNVYMAGGSVMNAGNIAGDVVVGGGTVVISGSVSGDIAAGGGNVTILSNTAGDLRVAGGNVVIQGSVGGDVIAGGGQITIGGLGVGGDVAAAGGSIRIDAPVRGSLKIAAGTVYINAPVAGNVTIRADKVTLGSKAVITGTLFYKASAELTKEDGAVIKGKITFEQRAKHTVPAAALAAIFSVWIIGKFLALLICSLCIGLVFKRYSKTAVAKATEHTLPELGRGLIVLVALPALSVLACVTVVGIPFGILGIISFVAALLFAWIMAPIIVGSVVYRYFTKGEWEISWKTILLGTFLYSVIGIIPFVGGLAQALIMFLSLGVIAAIKWEVVKQWR